MKELLKVVSKKFLILSFIVNIIYSFADYGEAFALSYFATSPLTLDKILKKHDFKHISVSYMCRK